MKEFLSTKTIVLALAGGLVFASCNNNSGNEMAAVELESGADSMSYALGVNISAWAQQNNLEGINPQILASAFAEAAGETASMSPEEATRYIQDFITRAQSEPSRAFLAENAQNPDVKVTESGLQYTVLVEGNGPIPTSADQVEVHYHGTLIDGTVFDSSVDRGEPIVFPVTGVIQGWVEALQMMPVGSKWKLFIPSELAYGNNPRPGGPIKPGDALIFEVELLSIK